MKRTSYWASECLGLCSSASHEYDVRLFLNIFPQFPCPKTCVKPHPRDHAVCLTYKSPVFTTMLKSENDSSYVTHIETKSKRLRKFVHSQKASELKCELPRPSPKLEHCPGTCVPRVACGGHTAFVKDAVLVLPHRPLRRPPGSSLPWPWCVLALMTHAHRVSSGLIHTTV